MDINLKEAADFMLAHDYILPVGKGKFKLSTKFHQEYAQLERGKADLLDYHGLPGQPTDVQFPARTRNLPQFTANHWEKQYREFVIEAQVPRRLEARRGETYPANTYSEAGMKAFKKAIEAGANYELMVKAVMLYYKSTVSFKMAVGRLMDEGHWKTYYAELGLAASQGAEAVNNLVTEQTKDPDVDHYQLG